MFDAEKRKSRRFPSIAKVQIPAAFSGDALLKDLSITGCRIECTMHVDVEEHASYTITVCPEENAQISRFDLAAQCKWLRPGSYSCDIGFDITASPGKKDFQKYVDYLSWRQGT